MKKLSIISSILIFCLCIASAQEFKGKGIIAPSVSFSSTKERVKTGDNNDDGNLNVSLLLSVPIGGFVSERVALGISPGYYYSRYKQTINYIPYPSLYERETNLFTVNGFCRYYGPIAEKLKFLLLFEAGIGFGSYQTTSNDGSTNMDKSKLSSFQAGVAPGFSFRVHDGVYLEATIGDLSYFHSVTKDEDASDESPRDHVTTFGLNFNTFSFGLMLLF